MAHCAVVAVESLSLFETGLQIVRRRWNPGPAILVDQDALSLGGKKGLNLPGALKCAQVELPKCKGSYEARQHYNNYRGQDPALHVVRPEGPMWDPKNGRE